MMDIFFCTIEKLVKKPIPFGNTTKPPSHPKTIFLTRSVFFSYSQKPPKQDKTSVFSMKEILKEKENYMQVNMKLLQKRREQVVIKL